MSRGHCHGNIRLQTLPEGQREALTIALADVDNALVCFRQLAAERQASA